MSRWQDFAAAANSLSKERQILRLGSMIALGKGKLESLGWLNQSNALKAHLLRWTPGEQPILILAVDIASNLSQPRGPSLRRVADMLQEYRPHLVLGDFNTPRHSSHLTPPAKGYRHAYWVAGKGWSYSWPAIFPMLAIDHALISDSVTLHRYRLANTLLSDHRPQILEFSLRSP
jgi:endonuclease/exonuclease/phosphatase family metal-dependent hydrolase